MDDNQDREIPVWVKIVPAVLTLVSVGILVRLSFGEQATILGIARSGLLISAMLVMGVTLPVSVGFWLYPASNFSTRCYYVLRLLREQIYVLALLGFMVLIDLRVPVFSIRGGVGYTGLFFAFLTGYFLKPGRSWDVSERSLPASWLKRISKDRPMWFVYALSACVPVLVMCAYIYLGLGSNFTVYGPRSLWNDEISYWNWIRSFVHVGLHSGYNAPNELLAAFELSRYGEASPFYLYIYGTIGWLTGWFPTLPLLINFGGFTLTLFLCFHFLRLDGWQLLLASLSVLVSWPVLLYLPLTTHETLNQVIGILFVLFLVRYQEQGRLWQGWQKMAWIGFVYVATLVRLSWGLFLIPVIFYCLSGSLLRRAGWAVVWGTGLYASAVLLMGYLLPPLNNSIMDTFKGGLVEGPLFLLERLSQQVRLIFEDGELSPNLNVFLQLLVILGWGLGDVISSTRSRERTTTILNSPAAFYVYAMAVLLFAGLAFYLQRGFYRTFAPMLLLVYLIQVAQRDYRRLAALLTLNVLFFSAYWGSNSGVTNYLILEADYPAHASQDPALLAEINTHIVYDPDAQDPWCNTLLIPLGFYDARLMLIPPGIGIAYIQNPLTFRAPFRSHYALLDAGTYKLYAPQMNLELLASLPIGDLYRNQERQCGKP